MSRDLGLSYKAAFVLCHKLREAMAEEMQGRTLGGEGKSRRGRWRLFRRLREAREPSREPRRSPPRRESKRQAQGRRHHPRARRRSLSRPCSSEAAATSSSARIVKPERSSTPTKRHAGMACMRRFEMKRINHRRPTRSTAPARIGRRNISAACAAPRSATITTSAAPTCSATPKRPHGAKTAAAWPMASKSSASPTSRSTPSLG